MGSEVCSCLVNTKSTTEPILEKSDQKKGKLQSGGNPMDETFMSTKSSLQSSFTRDGETKS
jgi:hypothetical protein